MGGWIEEEVYTFYKHIFTWCEKLKKANFNAIE